MIYVFMQTFAIPGTVSLSLLSGALFGTVRGLLLVAGRQSTSLCFSLSSLNPLRPASSIITIHCPVEGCCGVMQGLTVTSLRSMLLQCTCKIFVTYYEEV